MRRLFILLLCCSVYSFCALLFDVRYNLSYVQAEDNEAVSPIDKSLKDKISKLKEAVKQNPESGQARLDLSLAYFDANQVENSLREILTAIKYVPKSVNKAQKLSDMPPEHQKIFNEAIELQKKRLEDEAGEKLSSLLKIYPNCPEIIYNLAIQDVNTAKYKSFYERLYKANSLNPDTKENYRILGRLNLLLDNQTESENMFAKSLEIDRDYTPAYVGLGTLRLMQKNLEEGIYILEKAVKTDPSDYSAKITLSHIYSRMGQNKKAKDLLLQAVELNKSCWEAYHYLGTVYYALDDIENCIKTLKEVIVLRPNDIEPLMNLAKVYTMKAKYDEAIAVYKSAIKLEPKEFVLYCDLADLYIANNEFDNAIESYQKAFAINNTSPLAHYRIGTVYHKLKKYKNAESHWKKAVQQKQDFVEAYQALYMLYRDDLNNPKEADYYYKMQKLLAGE